MQEQPAPSVPPDGIREGSAPGPLGDSFLTGHRYPGEGAAPPAPAAPPAGAPPSRLFTRVVLPLLIFIAAIGALAWVTQYLPTRATAPSPDANPNPNAKSPSPTALLNFPGEFPNEIPGAGHVTDWEPERTRAEIKKWQALPADAKKDLSPPGPSPYRAEYEIATDVRQDGGHYDFAFTNPADEPTTLGLQRTTCQCSRVTACVLTTAEWARYQKLQAQADPLTRSRQSAEDGFSWTALGAGDDKGLTVPAKGRGVVRLFWEGRGKTEPVKALGLEATIWVGPRDNPAKRATTGLHAGIAYVRPAMSNPDRLDLGVLGPQAASVESVFHCWSATRDLTVNVRRTDPCFDLRPTRLSKQECRELTDALRLQGVMTRVKSAYRVNVTAYLQKDGKQLDLGTFHHVPQLEVRGDGEELQVPLPVIRGRVQGEVKVGGLEDQAAVNLKYFKARFGTTATATLWVKPGAQPQYEGFQPPVLNLKNVKLHKQAKQSVPDWEVWEIRLTVPPGLEPGPLPEDSALLLRLKETGRRVRIPLTGSAGRG